MKVIANVVNKEIAGLTITTNADVEFHKSTVWVLEAIANNAKLNNLHNEEEPIDNEFTHYALIGDAPFIQVCPIHNTLDTSANALRLNNGVLDWTVDAIGGPYRAYELEVAMLAKEIIGTVVITK